ncbi:hypothetical protein C1645_744584 [Glomus cerebriforme]|uniref:3CxxC-type domain-containing protein n=1 Tax=Glomus cerebriforme TaxID=658196 RepID=A0A397SF27_9GLOM|nr:hypothetical protein C1645_744584 [Glomus cerebriforme]
MQNNSESKEKTKNKFKKGEKRTYYKFICKCETGCNDFQEFLDHLRTSHQIKNINFTEVIRKGDGRVFSIKFYWHLSCQCGNKFSSSLCNADLKVNGEKIELLKKYNLSCLKCKKVARFDAKESLHKFLKQRVKQKLIYSFYKEKFAQFHNDSHSEKMLENHKEQLCEKCKLLGRHCGKTSIIRHHRNNYL